VIYVYFYPLQANQEANAENNVAAARDSYRVYRLAVFGLSFWFGLVLGTAIVMGIVGGVGVF